MQKLKQPAIKGMQIHNQREKESQTNADIDDSRSNLNYDLVNSDSIDYNEKINKRIEEGVTTGKTIRKDAVKLASFLVTSDSAFFENLSEREEKRFFESSYEFFANEYGEKNIAYAMVHKDEKTPHMHVGFVPITEDGRLSAKDFFGKKQQLVKLQDKFHDHLVKEGFDLERGVSSSRKHVETAKYKALTFQQMEKEAKEKYEKTMEQIQKIDDKTTSVEGIEAKKVLGLVGMKEQDYQSLVGYAKNGVAYQFQVENLQNELEKSKKEVAQLQSEMKTGQEKIRYYYKDIETNLEELSEKKAKEIFVQGDFVTKYNQLVDQSKELVSRYKNLSEEKKELEKELNDLKYEKQSYINENRDLKSQNETLKEQNEKLEERNQGLKEEIEKIQRYVRKYIVDMVQWIERAGGQEKYAKMVNKLVEFRDQVFGNQFKKEKEEPKAEQEIKEVQKSEKDDIELER